ncbi:MAG TPA: glycosyltransferase family 1 protein [Solirubrobacteraceae bacterium]
MRVAVDARALAGGRGVTRYLRELLTALARAHPEDEWHLFLPGRGAVLLELPPNVVVHRHVLPGRVLFGAAAVSGRPRIDRLVGVAPDVVWAPTIAPMALSPGVPLVLTIQDLSFELRPGDFTSYERLWHRVARPRALARRAARVIVLAPPTRGLLVDRWGLDGSRIEVVAPGVSVGSIAGRAPVHAGDPPGEYLLAVGALEPRKAPDLLVRAFVAARAEGLRARLVFAGEGRLAGSLAADGVTVLGQVSDADLEALYRGAVALVMPSLLEGYGLPVAEALARGTPAVISDLAVYGPELAPAVLRVPPGDQAALTTALLRLEREEGLRAALAAAAKPAVAGLSWEEAARRTRAVLAGAAGAGLAR